MEEELKEDLVPCEIGGLYVFLKREVDTGIVKKVDCRHYKPKEKLYERCTKDRPCGCGQEFREYKEVRGLEVKAK